MLRAIREIQPRWVVGENVRGLTNWNGGLVFDEVQADLENEGYEVTPYLLPACSVNAPHRRDRIWFVANAKQEPVKQGNNGREEYKPKDGNEVWSFNRTGCQNATNPNGIRQDASQREHEKQPGEGRQAENGYMGWEQRFVQRGPGRQWENFPTQPPICGGNDGISRRLDGITFPKWREKSIGAYGNAIVPQVALQIFKAIEAFNPGAVTRQKRANDEDIPF